MFCKNCGKALEGEQMICDECAAKEAAQAQSENVSLDALFDAAPVQEVPEVPEAPQAPEFTVNEEPVVPPVSKKANGLRTALIAVAAVALVAVLVAVFCWPSISSFVNRTFQTPAEYLITVEQKTLRNNGLFDGKLDSYMETMAATNSDNAAAQADITLTLSDTLTGFIETTLKQTENVELELDWLDSILLHCATNTDKNGTGVDLGIGINGKQILTFDVLVDYANNMEYMGIPEINKTYLSMAMPDLDAADYTKLLEQTKAIYADLAKAMPSEEKLEEMVDRMLYVALSQLSDVQKQTETVELDGLSQKFTVLETKISHEDAINIAVAVLEEAKENETFRALLQAYADYANAIFAVETEGVDYAWEDLTVEDILTEIDSAIASLKEETIFEDSYITMKTYVDMKDSVCGRAFISEEGEQVSYIVLRRAQDFALNAEAANVAISGKGTEEKDVVNGTITLKVDDKEACIFTLTDVSTAGDTATGTVKLVPGQMVIDALSEEMGSAFIGNIFGSSIALELEIADSKAALELLVGGDVFAAVQVGGSVNPAQPLQVPANAVSVDDDTALVGWIQTLDFANVLSDLKAAGVPEDYVTTLELLISQLLTIA